MKGVLWRGAAVFLIMLLEWYIGHKCGDRKRYGERRPLGENARKCGLIWWIEKTVIEIIQKLLCFWEWSLYQNWRILAIVRRGSCLLVCEPYERYYWLLEIMSNPICCGRYFSLATFDMLRLYAKSLKIRICKIISQSCSIKKARPPSIGNPALFLMTVCISPTFPQDGCC